MASFGASLHFHGLRRKLFTTAPSSASSILSQLSHTPCRPRFFTSSILLRAAAPKQAAKAARATKQTPSATVKAAASNVAPSRYAFIKSLATKPTPTVLYEGPSHFWFYFGCWSSGLSILGWTLLTGPTVIQQPEGIPKWVEYVYGAAYILLGAMGFYLISKTPNIVNTIRLMPPAAASAASNAAAGAAKAAKAATSIATQQPIIEVTVKRMVPFVQPKTITTTLDKVLLKSRLSLPEEYVPQLKRLEAQRIEEEKRKQLWKFDMEHLLTMPFRRVGRAFVGFFHGVRAAWTDMGFGVIKVDGKVYKVDVTQGFAHDGFRTLERLVDIGFKN